jgi:hypothetical protein
MNSKSLAPTSRRLLLLALLAAGFLLVAVPRAHALPCEDNFAEAVGSGWSTNANWSTGQPPTSVQNVCLEAGTQAVVASGVGAEARTVTGPVPLRIDAGGTLTLAQEAQLVGANVVDGEIAGSGATVTLKSGSLVGTGTIGPRFINEAGVVEPGGDGVVGTLSFGGEYAQDEGARLDLDLASDSSFDRLQPSANGNALIAGHIDVAVLGSYAPAVGTTWDFISGSGGASPLWTVAPSEFSAHAISGGAELRLDSALPSGPGAGGKTPGGGSGGEAPGGGGSGGEGPSGGSGGSSEPGGAGNVGGSGQSSSPLAPSGPGTTDVPGRCGSGLVLTAAIKGGHLIFTGTAPKSAAGERVRILRGAKPVAKAKVRANGRFSAKVPAPRARRHGSVVYVASVGSLRSCPVRLKSS